MHNRNDLFYGMVENSKSVTVYYTYSMYKLFIGVNETRICDRPAR